MESNNQFTLLRLLKTNLLVAIGYLLLGYIGTMLATPSHASPIWPASGLALASVLVYGIAIIPGLLTGALLINSISFLDISTIETFQFSIIKIVGISIGSCFQAVFAAYLINHFLGKQNPLIKDASIFLFFFLGALVACLVSSSISISILYFLDELLTLKEIFFSWSTWWIGDSIGVITFAPIILTFIAKPKHLWHERQKLVTLPLLLLLAVGISIFQYTQKMESKRIVSVFERQVETLHSTVENEIHYRVEITQILKDFIENSSKITEKKFKIITQPFIDKHQSIQAMAWVSSIHSKQRKLYEDADFEGLIIQERNENNEMVRAKERSEYFPISYIEPLEKNRRALGFDLGTNDPIDFRAIQKAIATKQTTITAPFQLIQDLEKKIGLVLYSPVFQENKDLENSVDKRRLIGLAAVVFRMEDEMKLVFSRIPDIQLLVKIEDIGDKIYTNYTDPLIANSNPLHLQKIEKINVADRVWQLTYSPSAEFYQDQPFWVTWWVFLISGFIITAFSGIGLLMISGRTLRTEELVRIRSRALAQSEQQFRELVQFQPAIFWRLDPENMAFTFVSDEAEKILGYPVKQWLEEKNFWINHMHEDDKIWAPEYCKKQTLLLNCHQFEYRMRSKAAKIVWLRDVVKVISKNGIIIEIMGAMIDITDRRNAEEKLKLNESKYKTLFKNAVEALLVIDLETLRFVDANENALELFGINLKTIREIGPLDISAELKSNEHSSSDFLKNVIKKLYLQEHLNFEKYYLNKQGKEILCSVSLSLLPSLDRNLAVASLKDITEQRKSEEEIYKLAYFDPLTKLANRRLLLNQLSAEMSSAKRKSVFGAVIFLDLDRFKLLNDSLGHHVGDELLVQVANRIVLILREEDLAARLGGDEFVIMIKAYEPSLKQIIKSTLAVAEKIRISLEKPYIISNYEHHCSSSIGVTFFPEPNVSAAEVIQQADTAMYRSKERGRNTISLFHFSLQQAADAKLFLEKEIRLALQNQDFILYYQPQFNQAGIPVSVEALIRWQHAERGLISPVDFIPNAEESNLINQIGEWVLNQACAQMRNWLDGGFELNHIAINVSSKQLRQVDFVSQVKQAISTNKIQANQLYVELTEGVVIDDIEDTIQKLQALKELGVKISIDDFGTGYSSLAYLKQLPFDQLKIDKDFVRDITTDENDAIIVETIINMAKNLSLEVVAEGVEIIEQRDFLVSKGCTMFQGYYYSKPLPISEFNRYFENLINNAQTD